MQNTPNKHETQICVDCKHCSRLSPLHVAWCENPTYAPPNLVDGKPRALMCSSQRANNVNCPEYVKKEQEQEVKKETLVSKFLHWFKPKVQ